MNKYVEDLRQHSSGMTPNLMGFTLIELLVVVLIIGILAAVALPQYQKAVEKSRLMECVQQLTYANQAYQLAHLANGEVTDTALRNGAIDVSNFSINADKPLSGYCGLYIDTLNNEIDSYSKYVTLEMGVLTNSHQTCYTKDTDMGNYLCKTLIPLGWTLEEGDQ